MNEVEKMYENVGIKKVKDYYCPICETKLEDCFGEHKDYVCPNESCDYVLCEDDLDFQECLEHLSYREGYPQFTAEKQLELIKWLSTKELKIRTNKQPYAIYIGILSNDNTCFFGCEGLYFEQTLAEVINTLWQSLTEEERKQIKEILE